MTLHTAVNRVQYIGNGLAVNFPAPFPVPQPEHLRLFLWDGRAQTELTGGFTVVGAGTAAVFVVFDQPPAAGAIITLLRQVPLVQPMDLANGGAFNAEILEGSADNLEMQIQQLQEEVGRAIVAPERLLACPRHD